MVESPQANSVSCVFRTAKYSHLSIELSTAPLWDALEEQPQTNGELKQEDRTAEVPDVDHLRELGENDEGERTNADPGRGKQSPHGQRFGDVSRPEPQVAEHRRTEAKEKQSDVIRGAVRSDADARQRRHLI